MKLKFNAQAIDEIEQAKGISIENCIGDTSISTISLFVQKGLVDDNGNHNLVTKNMAMSEIDKYLQENDKDDLIMYIMESLINAGFLSREIDIEKIKKSKTKAIKEALKEM